MKEYYRVQADIDLDAIYENIRNTKKRIKDGTKIMAVIKADGYGHGAVAVAKTIDKCVDAYGVAIVEEAVELRKMGITKDILILGVSSKEQYETIVKYDIMQTTFDLDMAKCLDMEAKKQNKKAKVHIKLDTGMTRIGFKDNDDSIEVIKKINELDNIIIDGIFSHFACADEKDKTSANRQFERFTNFVNKLEANGIKVNTKHISNSAGIIDMKEVNLDMVRSGISTYGLYPSNEVNKDNLILKPAMTIKTRITFVKEVEEGVGVSYNSTYVTKKKTKIATIPVGYADGYPRQLSSKGRVLIHGKSVSIIGRICMDQFMVDVSDIDDVKAGDEVTLVGKDKNEFISVEELSSLAGSFNYEFVCDIGKRIPRVYYRNGKKVGTFDYYECTKYALTLEDI